MAQEDPAEAAERQRRVRNDIFESGAYPYGDKRVNPQRKRTAYEYHEWTKTQQSHQADEGAYRDMLEAEERHMGQSSYPPGHPRREAAMSGLPDVHIPEARSSESGRGFPNTNLERLMHSGAYDQEPVRPNRFTTTCDKCGEKMLPGEGRMEREPTRWISVHHPRCPS